MLPLCDKKYTVIKDNVLYEYLMLWEMLIIHCSTENIDLKRACSCHQFCERGSKPPYIYMHRRSQRTVSVLVLDERIISGFLFFLDHMLHFLMFLQWTYFTLFYLKKILSFMLDCLIATTSRWIFTYRCP